MIRRLYIHNFRSMENFELVLADCPSALLIGANGAGKSTIGFALELFQTVARGNGRVSQLLSPKDFTRGQTDVPMRFELEATLHGAIYRYVLAFELPPRFKELRVLEERLFVGGTAVFSREVAEVVLDRGGSTASFRVDWHQVALPLLQEESSADPIATFRSWLARSLVVAPIPAYISGESAGETLHLARDCSNLAAVFTGLLASHPAAYSRIEGYLRDVMPEFLDVTNPLAGKESRILTARFRAADSPEAPAFTPAFEDLSQGEKSFFICAVFLAANEAYGPLLCFWDEPDSHLALGEVGHFVQALRRSFRGGSQLIVTSHHPEAIQRFSDENTFLLHRRSRLEPTTARRLDQMQVTGDLISALLRGDVVP